MAATSMNDIKSRIKSVGSTMQITKAMELVATSKLRRAKERVERARPFYETLSDAINTLLLVGDAKSSRFFTGGEGKTLFVVIAGDRGLAGGYNSNIFRMTEVLARDTDAIFLPIGKKALEYYKHRGREIFSEEFGTVADIGVGDAFDISALIAAAYSEEKIGKVILIYTKFVSMMTQTPVYEELLPFGEPECDCVGREPLIEEEADEMLEKIVPYYIGGIIYSAVCESSASESGARRSAMNAANKNAEEMINTLMLKYNRARQAIITQEITEIVSGAQG